jgi:hypothetical protein
MKPQDFRFQQRSVSAMLLSYIQKVLHFATFRDMKTLLTSKQSRQDWITTSKEELSEAESNIDRLSQN